MKLFATLPGIVTPARQMLTDDISMNHRSPPGLLGHKQLKHVYFVKVVQPVDKNCKYKLDFEYYSSRGKASRTILYR